MSPSLSLTLTSELLVQRGRADAESASECMAGLKTVCADQLGALEDSIAGAMQAVTAIQAAQRKQKLGERRCSHPHAILPHAQEVAALTVLFPLTTNQGLRAPKEVSSSNTCLVCKLLTL